MFSAVHPTTDIAKILPHVRFVPERTNARSYEPPSIWNTGPAVRTERLDSRANGPIALVNCYSLRMPPDAARFGMPFEDGLECRARRQAIADQHKGQTPAIEKSLKGIVDDVRPDGDQGIDSWNDVRKSSREILCVKVLAAIVYEFHAME